MTEKVLLKKIGLKIKQLRTEKGVSQLALGVEIDVEKSNISRMESGRVNPRIFTLYKVANALEIPLADLLSLD
ncbi:MAG TPA: helix-turn-helix transcriptional regulator [Segetibacter sp.]